MSEQTPGYRRGSAVSFCEVFAILNALKCADRGATMPARKTKPVSAEVILEVILYDKLLATLPEIERKGDANPYTSLNGNMFTLLQASRNLAIRLPENRREEFIKKHKTRLFEAYGAVMQEYVAVPGALLENTKELQKWLGFSYEYAKTLKPKPTKKKH
jgi:hypothetical protein